MSYEDPTQVVVIEDQRRRRMLPWVAGAAAIALLATGGTFALWRASAQFTGGQVTAGDLDLKGCANDDITWYDISPDRRDAEDPLSFHGVDFSDSVLLAASGEGSIHDLALAKSAYTTSEGFYPPAGYVNAQGEGSYTTYITEDGEIMAHEIEDITTWRMVPGDTILAVCEDALVTLEGDNLVAALELVDEAGNPIGIVSGNGVTGEDVTEWDMVVTGAEVYVNGEAVTSARFYTGYGTESEALRTDVPASYTGGTLAYLGAPPDGQEDGITDESNPWVAQLAALQADGETPATEASNAKDLRSSAAVASDHRMSLGQGYVTAIFAVHFVDDGIDGDAKYVIDTPAVPESATGTCADGIGTTRALCETDGGTWTPTTAAVPEVGHYVPTEGKYTGKGTGDGPDEANGRYLATDVNEAGNVLATLGSGRLVLKQIRQGAGGFAPTISPAP